MMRMLRHLAALALWLALAAPAAVAQSLVSTGQSFVTATLLPGEMREDGTRLAGIALDLAPGWKTYWRSPGEAGVPPEFDFSRSANLARARVLWPRPIRFESFGTTTIGYSDRVILPVELTPVRAGEAIALRLDMTLGVCREICVLEEASLSRAIGPGATGGAARVRAARETVPGPPETAGIARVTCRIAGAGKERRFTARIEMFAPPAAPVVLLEGTEAGWFHGVSARARGSAVEVEAGLRLADPGAWIGRGDIRMTLLGDRVAADIRGCEAPEG